LYPPKVAAARVPKGPAPLRVIRRRSVSGRRAGNLFERPVARRL